MRMEALASTRSLRGAISPNALRLMIVLAVVVTCELGVIWLRWTRSVDAEIVAVTAAHGRAKALVASAPVRRDSIQQLQAALEASRDSFLLAPSSAQSASAAAAALREIASDASAQLGAINVHADSAEHRGVRWVSVEGEATGSFDVLTAFEREIESGEPFIVKHFALAPVPSAYGGIAGMRARFTLSAAARRGFAFER